MYETDYIHIGHTKYTVDTDISCEINKFEVLSN